MLFAAAKSVRLLLSLASLLAFCQSNCHAYTIQGQIEHVESLPAVAPELRSGAEYTGPGDSGVNNKWQMIPHWLAGTWLVRQETAVYQRDYKTGRVSDTPRTYRAKQEFFYGSQLDRNGNVWHFNGVPYTSETRLSDYIEYHKVTSKTFQVANANEVRFRTLMTVVRVSPSTETIIKSFQQESITSYKPDGDGQIQLTSSIKAFDDNGNAVHETCNTATIKRIKPFVQIDHRDGKDLAHLFKNYLIKSNMTYLLP
ncbi:MAG: hypothetical protein IPI39_18505 [Candidatus Obscuribacter sp.]|jgi:hypothetical protein|nr:hypothetical protein [Candidatus Obscuribacter sp.]